MVSIPLINLKNITGLPPVEVKQTEFSAADVAVDKGPSFGDHLRSVQSPRSEDRDEDRDDDLGTVGDDGRAQTDVDETSRPSEDRDATEEVSATENADDSADEVEVSGEADQQVDEQASETAEGGKAEQKTDESKDADATDDASTEGSDAAAGVVVKEQLAKEETEKGIAENTTESNQAEGTADVEESTGKASGKDAEGKSNQTEADGAERTGRAVEMEQSVDREAVGEKTAKAAETEGNNPQARGGKGEIVAETVADGEEVANVDGDVDEEAMAEKAEASSADKAPAKEVAAEPASGVEAGKESKVVQKAPGGSREKRDADGGPEQSNERPEKAPKPFKNPTAAKESPNPQPVEQSQQTETTVATVRPTTQVAAPAASAEISGQQISAEGGSDNQSGPTIRPTSNQVHKAAASRSQGGEEPGRIDAARFVQRVAKAFQTLGEKGGNVRLRLAPPELGSLRLDISVRNGAMTARVEAENATARSLLLENLPALRERLAEQNIRIEQFDVGLSDHSGGEAHRHTADQTRQHERGHGDGASTSRDQPEGEQQDERQFRRPSRPGEGAQLNVIV